MRWWLVWDIVVRLLRCWGIPVGRVNPLLAVVEVPGGDQSQGSDVAALVVDAVVVGIRDSR